MFARGETIPTVKVLGSMIHVIQLHDVVARMEKWIEQDKKKCRQVVVTGFHGIWEAHKNPDFKKMLNSADLWVPDGIAPVWLARCRGFRRVQRTPGVDIIKTFLELANQKGYSSFFYGDTDETLAKLKENAERQYPNHRIAGTLSPPFRQLTSQEDEQIIKIINDAKPDVLWVALGLPKQEQWIFEHKDRLKVPVVVGVGAAFGFLSGKVKRAPSWVGNCGLEWAWRLIMEPKKVWRRDLLDGPRFIGYVLLELTGLKNYD